MEARVTLVLTVEIDAVLTRALRVLLKRLLRSYGVRCKSITSTSTDAK